MPAARAPRRRAKTSTAAERQVTGAVAWLRTNRASLERRGPSWVAVSSSGEIAATGRSLREARSKAIKSGLGGQFVLSRVARRTRIGLVG